jgi:hypothetical protein
MDGSHRIASHRIVSDRSLIEPDDSGRMGSREVKLFCRSGRKRQCCAEAVVKCHLTCDWAEGEN